MPFGLLNKTPSILNKEQKGVLGSFKKLEKKGHADFKATAVERIAELYLQPKSAGLSEREITRRADSLYQACKHVLRKAPLTTNVNSSLFLNDGFYNSQQLETVWTVPTNKGFNYFNTRQTVEQGVFGYKVDWSVPISVAARTRPAYAGLNYTSHPYGAAPSYGSVALFLKANVHARCTFIATDTFDNKFDLTGGNADNAKAARGQITTDARIGNLCATISNNQLKALCQVAESAYGIVDDVPNYIEAHLHGSILWSRDLECIRIASSGAASYTKELAAAKRNEAAFKMLVASWAKRHSVRASIWNKGNEIEVLNA